MARPTRLIKVTKRDIKLGARNSTTDCPVARAARRAYRCPQGILWCGVEAIGIGADVGEIADGVIYRLPDKAQRWIERFDSWGKVRPFSFRPMRYTS